MKNVLFIEDHEEYRSILSREISSPSTKITLCDKTELTNLLFESIAFLFDAIIIDLNWDEFAFDLEEYHIRNGFECYKFVRTYNKIIPIYIYSAYLHDPSFNAIRRHTDSDLFSFVVSKETTLPSLVSDIEDSISISWKEEIVFDRAKKLGRFNYFSKFFSVINPINYFENLSNHLFYFETIDRKVNLDYVESTNEIVETDLHFRSIIRCSLNDIEKRFDSDTVLSPVIINRNQAIDKFKNMNVQNDFVAAGIDYQKGMELFNLYMDGEKDIKQLYKEELKTSYGQIEFQLRFLRSLRCNSTNSDKPYNELSKFVTDSSNKIIEVVEGEVVKISDDVVTIRYTNWFNKLRRFVRKYPLSNFRFLDLSLGQKLNSIIYINDEGNLTRHLQPLSLYNENN